MTSTGSVRTASRAALTTAMKQRDREAVSVYRTALAAIANAEAVVPTGEVPAAGAIEAAAVGAGAADVARRELTDEQVVATVRAEAEERRAAAALPGLDPVAADRLLHEATLLDALVEGQRPE